MDLLINEDDVRARMALPAEINITDFVESAIIASQQWVEQKFCSPITKVTAQVDQFFLDPAGNHSVQVNGFYRLKLRQGLLTAVPTVQAGDLWGSTGVDLASLVLNTDFRANSKALEQGIIQVDALLWGGKYVTVTYNAGYEAGDDLPDWLKEAILAYVPAVFNFGPQTQRDPEAEKGYQASADHAEAVMALHARSRSVVLRPL